VTTDYGLRTTDYVMSYIQIEATELYLRTCKLADDVFLAVMQWDFFSKDTIGKQLVRCLDSIGANLVEGDGRASVQDTSRFFVYARASAREARHFIRSCRTRNLLPIEQADAWIAEVTEIGKMIHAFKKHRESQGSKVKESRSSYGEAVPDPFDDADATFPSPSPRSP
jgi:four helix bundle protein